MKRVKKCPACGAEAPIRLNPYLTVDIIIEVGDRIVLIERGGEPEGWAIPGGFVDYGETVEAAAVREAREETGLDVELVRQFHVYSDPRRDPRQHNASVVFIAKAEGEPKGGDDAKRAALFTKDSLPQLAFDHEKILDDYFNKRY
ncbi:MAG: NUDIX domain-containing protein [Candidatus Nitrospinota bacterium M3_3B_026]